MMALELFKPFVMKTLVDRELAQNIKSAKRMVERRRPQVWDVLEDVIKEHPVLLNRAPTLHRLGIQAFEPVLVEGKAIQIHPLVCTAFNADFDGDQMAVHLPLSAEAQAEARVLMLCANNVLSPANGRPLVTPTQDMIIGAFYLTDDVDGANGEGRVFRDDRAGRAGLRGRRRRPARQDPVPRPAPHDRPRRTARPPYEQTTPGRVLFNSVLPEGFGYVNGRSPSATWARSSTSWPGTTPRPTSPRPRRHQGHLLPLRDAVGSHHLDRRRQDAGREARDPRPSRGEADKVEQQFRRGIITDGERRQKEVEIWTEATEEVTQAMEDGLKAEQFNPIDMMVGSGARGNMMQVRQIAGMRGLVANPRGDMIPRPIKSNFREGLTMLEYFIATPGARKGLVDTALRTADSGYLTRRLVDVAQELIINDEDPFERAEESGRRSVASGSRTSCADTPDKRSYLETRSSVASSPTTSSLADGTDDAKSTRSAPWSPARSDACATTPRSTRVRVLSPLTDDSEFGISAKTYGMSLATGKLIERRRGGRCHRRPVDR